MLSTRERLAMVVMMAVLGAAAVGMTTTAALAMPQPLAPRQIAGPSGDAAAGVGRRPAATAGRDETADAARPGEPGMPATPVLLFGVLMLAGLAALAVLVLRLDIRGAKRATAALGSDAVEEELQQMIAEALAWRRASTGA